MAKYRKYDPSVIEMVRISRNPNLFPHLDIPRSTAIGWIKSGRKTIKIKDTSFDVAYVKRINDLEKELESERAKVLFLSTLLKKISGFSDLLKIKKNREPLVDCILEFSKWISKKRLCELATIRESSFFKYKVETKGCERVGFKQCKIMSPNQLTFIEQQHIYTLAHDEKLRHLSIKGLQLYAFREGIVNCSYDSWRKYVREFRASQIEKKKKKYRTGIRASRVNEIWHLDITEFKCIDGGKVYLQALMDNYSRKIVHWRISRSKSQALTIQTFHEAIGKSKPENILSDGGGENTSHDVRRLFLGKGINSIIAKRDISFSNSMIEGFFRTLKTMYVNKYKLYRTSKLYNAIRRSVLCYNEMPLSSLNGARPNEVFTGEIRQDSLEDLQKSEIRMAREKRPGVNRSCFRGYQVAQLTM